MGILICIAYLVRQDIYGTELVDQPHRKKPVMLLEKRPSYTSLSSKTVGQNGEAEQSNAAVAQTVLFKQREQLYLQFSEIMSALGQGQRPDAQQLSLLVTQQQTLVEAKLVTRDEAKAQIEFLLKVLPDMDYELHRALKALEHTQL